MHPVVTRQPDPAARRTRLLPAAAAGLCWATVLAMLAAGLADPALPVLAPIRLIFYGLVLVAGLLTFVPFQRRMQLPGLVLEGVGGTFLLAYTLAFVPPPTGWLLDLPDMPVYVILALGLGLSVAAAALPPLYALGGRLFQQRARRYDLRRARRQARAVGILAAVCVLLAGLRALRPTPVLLVALLLAVTELLFLSFVDTEGVAG